MAINQDFSSRILANMNVALDRVCTETPGGEQHQVRKRVARQIVKCARSGNTTLGDLVAAGRRGLIGVAAARELPSPARQRTVSSR